jgi:hypothetical protein
MKKLQEHFKKACEALGLDIHLDYAIDLESKKQIMCPVYIPHLGNTKGMIVVTTFYEIKGVERELLKQGYGYSCISEPSGAFQKEAFIELFNDWGWSGPSTEKPHWMHE